MSPSIPGSLREFDRWLNAGAAEAEALVPALLALPGPMLLAEVRKRRELRTPGVLRRLLAVARDAIVRFPSRAHELTLIVARYARSMDVPAGFAFVSQTLHGEAWRDHASALSAIGRGGKALNAVRRARRSFEAARMPGSLLSLATVDLVEAPLLYDRGLHAEALAMVRRAAHAFDLFQDHARFVEACMAESWMLWSGGDRDRGANVWTETAAMARQRGDDTLMARLAAKMGVLELRHGRPDQAARLLAEALRQFGANAPKAATRTRWHLAEAAAAQERFHVAISEYHLVRAELLAQGAVIDAAMAGVESVGLHLVAAREDELPSLLTTFAETFRDSYLPVRGLEAILYLRSRALAGALRQSDVVLVRSFLEELVLNPITRFEAP